MTREITLEDVVSIYPYQLKRIVNKGQMELVGPCFVCGGKDRFSLYTGRDGKCHWACRQAGVTGHANQPRSYWFGDALYKILTGKDWETDPTARAMSQRGAPVGPVKKFPKPPKWDELLTSPVRVSMALMEKYATSVEAASRILGKYCLEVATLARFKVGYASDLTTRLAAGCSIPNIAHGANNSIALRGMQIRRDEAFCRTLLSAKGEAWIKQQSMKLMDEWLIQLADGKRADIAHAPTEADLIEWLWPKYTSIEGSQAGIWGDELVTLPDNSRIGPRLPFIFVVEDAKSAMVLRQLKFPAVAYRQRYDWNAWLPRVFKQIPNVYIIADRDESPNNFGKGQLMAQQLAGFIHQADFSNVFITMPPPKRNDIADIARDDGLYAVETWLRNKFPGTLPLTDHAYI